MATYRVIGNTVIQSQHRASCHCGKVVLMLDLPEGVINPRHCNCSICRLRGAVMASVPLAGLHIVSGENHLTLYQFNTRTAKHYFCKVCGIYTHHQRRSDPSVYAFNVACLDGVDPFVLGQLPVADGLNHVADRRS